jgi:hypothetical protein
MFQESNGSQEVAWVQGSLLEIVRRGFIGIPQLLFGLTIKLLLHAIRHAGLFPEFIGPADDFHPHRIFHLALLE